MLREYAASAKAHPSAKAVELFQRALEIQTDEATKKREPEGRRNEYIAIEIALMRGTSRKRLGCKCAGRRRECGRAAGVGNKSVGNQSRGVKPFHCGVLCSGLFVRRRSLQVDKKPVTMFAPVAGVRCQSPRCSTNGWASRVPRGGARTAAAPSRAGIQPQMTGARLRDGPEADICIYDRKTTTRASSLCLDANEFVVE